MKSLDELKVGLCGFINIQEVLEAKSKGLLCSCGGYINQQEIDEARALGRLC